MCLHSVDSPGVAPSGRLDLRRQITCTADPRLPSGEDPLRGEWRRTSGNLSGGEIGKRGIEKRQNRLVRPPVGSRLYTAANERPQRLNPVADRAVLSRGWLDRAIGEVVRRRIVRRRQD